MKRSEETKEEWERCGGAKGDLKGTEGLKRQQKEEKRERKKKKKRKRRHGGGLRAKAALDAAFLGDFVLDALSVGSVAQSREVRLDGLDHESVLVRIGSLQGRLDHVVTKRILKQIVEIVTFCELCDHRPLHIQL